MAPGNRAFPGCHNTDDHRWDQTTHDGGSEGPCPFDTARDQSDLQGRPLGAAGPRPAEGERARAQQQAPRPVEGERAQQQATVAERPAEEATGPGPQALDLVLALVLEATTRYMAATHRWLS